MSPSMVLFGAIVGGAALLAYLTGDGLLSAAGLIVAVFIALVFLGTAIAAATEVVTIASIGAALRSIRHRHADQTCGVCARITFHNGAASICPSCDLIPAVVVA